MPQEPKEPIKQAPRAEEPAKKIEVADPKEVPKLVVVDAPEAAKVDEKPAAPPVIAVVDQIAPLSGGAKQEQAEAPVAPAQEQAPEKRHEQVSFSV